jgi:hypothetical protein
MTAKILVPKVMKTAKTDISTNMDTEYRIFSVQENLNIFTNQILAVKKNINLDINKNTE